MLFWIDDSLSFKCGSSGYWSQLKLVHSKAHPKPIFGHIAYTSILNKLSFFIVLVDFRRVGPQPLLEPFTFRFYFIYQGFLSVKLHFF
jgi:hypothetical protein